MHDETAGGAPVARLTAKEAAALDKLVRRLFGSGPPAEQVRQLEQRLAQPDAPEAQYEQWLLAGARVYQRLAEAAVPGSEEAADAAVRAALPYVYLSQHGRARAMLPPSRAAERAYLRLFEVEAATRPKGGAPTPPSPPSEEAAKLYAAAGQELLQARRPVQAALAYQAAGRLDAAQASWQQVLADSRLPPYQQALVRVNLSLAWASQDKRPGSAGERTGERVGQRAAHREAAAAQLLLEEVADDAERCGERERALDCYRVLLQLGQALGRFENVAEGYLNCIRILKEEQLRLHALRYYEDFARVGTALGEHHTVAQVCREAADSLDRRGLDPALRRRYLRQAAEAAQAAAQQLQRQGGTASLCEHAYLLAIESWNALDDFVRVRDGFAALAALPLPAERKERYRHLAASYTELPAATPTAMAAAANTDAALPAFLRQQQAYPPVWLLDLQEWEAGGDPAAVCLSLLGDTQRAAVTRRQALWVLLLAYGPRPADPQARRQQLLAQASGLSNLRAYEALRPLERLYSESLPRPGAADELHEVRAALLAAPPKLLFKRALYLVLRGLDDPHPQVRQQALMSLARLHFPDAIAPLCRLFRERPEPAVRSAVLQSLGRAHDLRAGEFLLDVLRHEPEPLRNEARQLLLRYDNRELLPLLHRSLELDSGPARPALQAVLAHLRGEPPAP